MSDGPSELDRLRAELAATKAELVQSQHPVCAEQRKSVTTG